MVQLIVDGEVEDAVQGGVTAIEGDDQMDLRSWWIRSSFGKHVKMIFCEIIIMAKKVTLGVSPRADLRNINS